MRYACLMIGVLAITVGLAAYSAEPEKVVLENSHLRMVFENNPSPLLREFIKKSSGKNLISEKGSPLFSIRLRIPGGRTKSFESTKAVRGTARVQKIKSGQKITLTYEDIETLTNLTVTLEGTLANDEPIVRWKMSVSNPALCDIYTIRFPYMKQLPVIGDPADDFFVGPSLPGVIIENPDANWKHNYAVSWTFPGGQSAQFCSYQDKEAGVYLASMDVNGNPRTLFAGRDKETFYMYHEFMLPEKPVPQWTAPYETAFGVTSGTWQDTADIYKNWAEKQFWCAQTLDQRDDIPDYLKAGPCIHTCEVRTYTNRYISGSYYPDLVNHMKSMRESIGGGPVIPMLPGWENHRRWTAGEYFPIFDEEHALPVLKNLKEEGFIPFVYLSGLFYTYLNEGRDGCEISSWKQYADSLVIDKSTGKPKKHVLNESSPGKSGVWKRHSYSFCPAAPSTKAFFRSVIDKLHGAGIDFVQMDQTVSGAGDICASKDHGHLPGNGSYRSQAFQALLADMRKYGKSLSPEFALAHEELHEELIPVLDAFHSREYKENTWYRGYPGSRGIPLFTYLYHEYAIVYGGEGPHTTSSKSQEAVREMAVNLATGKTPGVSVWTNQKAMAQAHPDQIQMLRNHMNLMNTDARQFLMLGRMLHSFSFECETLTWQIKKKPFSTPAVLTSSWQAPDGSIGHCFVNITDQPRKVELALDTRGAQGWKKADIDLINANTSETSSLYKSANLPQSHSLELGPLDAVFIIMRPAA